MFVYFAWGGGRRSDEERGLVEVILEFLGLGALALFGALNPKP